MNVQKLEAMKAELKKTHTQYEYKAVLVDLIDALIEHEQEDEKEHEKLEEEIEEKE